MPSPEFIAMNEVHEKLIESVVAVTKDRTAIDGILALVEAYYLARVKYVYGGP
jgi:hypothetical protein